MPPWHLLSEASGVIETFPGAPAWVGTGLLGGVLGWLLFVHLPAKDKQIGALIADHDEKDRAKDQRHDAHTERLAADFNKTMEAVVARFTDRERERQDYFRESLTVVTNHCEKELTQVGDGIRRKLDEFQQVVDEVRKEMGRRGMPPQ